MPQSIVRQADQFGLRGFDAPAQSKPLTTPKAPGLHQPKIPTPPSSSPHLPQQSTIDPSLGTGSTASGAPRVMQPGDVNPFTGQPFGTQVPTAVPMTGALVERMGSRIWAGTMARVSRETTAAEDESELPEWQRTTRPRSYPRVVGPPDERGWTKNEYGGYRNEDNTRYVGQTPKKFYQIWHRPDQESGWKPHSGPYNSANEAREVAERI